MNLAHISSSVIFIITITILTGENLNICKIPNDTCLQYYVIPVHYHIKLTHIYMGKCLNDDFYWTKLNIKNEYDSFNFYGESSTTINILLSTQHIKLHMLSLDIINDSNITFIKSNGIIYAPKTYIKAYETNISEFRFTDILPPGIYTFKIEFFGLLTENSEKSFFKSFYTNKKNGIAWVNIKQLKIHIYA